MKNLMSTLTSLNFDKTVIAYSNGIQVFKGTLQDYLCPTKRSEHWR